MPTGRGYQFNSLATECVECYSTKWNSRIIPIFQLSLLKNYNSELAPVGSQPAHMLSCIENKQTKYDEII